MPRQYDEVANNVQAMIGDESARLWTVLQIAQWIAEAEGRIVRAVPGCNKTIEQVAVGFSGAEVFATKFIDSYVRIFRVSGLWDSAGTTPQPPPRLVEYGAWDLEDPDWKTTVAAANYPTEYTIAPGDTTIWYYPKLDYNCKLEIEGDKIINPEVGNAATNTVLNEKYHNMMENYAAFKCLSQDTGTSNAVNAEKFLTLFNEELAIHAKTLPVTIEV